MRFEALEETDILVKLPLDASDLYDSEAHDNHKEHFWLQNMSTYLDYILPMRYLDHSRPYFHTAK